MDTRVRFAPSPTGNVHIGNIRTAIFNWLFARNTKGKFLLRIEDTDKERSTREAIDKLLECMTWLGLDFDEKIYYQSDYEEAHRKAAEKMVENGFAYYAELGNKISPIMFRIPLDTEKCKNVRVCGPVEIAVHCDVPIEISYTGVKFAQIGKNQNPVEYTACLAGFKDLKAYDTSGNVVFEFDEKVKDVLSAQKCYSIPGCSKIAFTRREVFYKDIIKGELSKPLDSLRDFVILRSDASPVFHLANVYDDVMQNITHIIRGDDHVENTYRHIFLFYALDFPIPQYGHMPMIVNRENKPYSKRDGDAFVGDFKLKGFLPEALFNYLSLLGWSPGDDREKMSRVEMVDAFSLARVKSSPAQFDMTKLLNMNSLYMAEMAKDDFCKLAYMTAQKQGWTKGISGEDFAKVAELLQSRTKLISMVEEWKYFFFDDSPFFHNGGEEYPISEASAPVFDYDVKAFKKAFKNSEAVNGVKKFCEILVGANDFSIEGIAQYIREAEIQCGLQEHKLNQPLRLALTGKTSGAGLHETLYLLGSKRIINRLNEVLKTVKL